MIQFQLLGFVPSEVDLTVACSTLSASQLLRCAPDCLVSNSQLLPKGIDDDMWDLGCTQWSCSVLAQSDASQDALKRVSWDPRESRNVAIFSRRSGWDPCWSWNVTTFSKRSIGTPVSRNMLRISQKGQSVGTPVSNEMLPLSQEGHLGPPGLKILGPRT